MKRSVLLALLLTAAPVAAPVAAQETKLAVKHTKDIIYGRKHGVVLTMDAFAPAANGNGAAVIWCVSGGWYSSHAAIGPAYPEPFLKRGYTVFAVVHGSQPKFTIPEILEDMHRATRYIRSRAQDFKIDPERIGITGGSAGGHLSLMQGLAGNQGDPKAKDPIDRLSSRVQAVACFYPPTDFLNYGKAGEDALGRGILSGFKAPFMFTEYDKATKSFVLITDEERFKEIGRKISPINHVSADDPPTLITHGDADTLVPYQQAEILIAKLKEAGVPAELVTKKGAGHGWPNLLQDLTTFVDWFDRHLKKAPMENK